MLSLEFIPAGSGTNLIIPETEIRSLNATKTHTGVATFSFSLKGNRSLEDRAIRQNRVNLNAGNTTVFTGYLTGCSHTKSTGTTEIKGKGIAKRLQEGKPDLSNGPINYQNVFAEDAIRDYWGRTPFGNATVSDQDKTVVVTNDVQQSATTTAEFDNLLSIPDDQPLTTANDELSLAQSNFVGEAEDNITINSALNIVSNVDYSGGVGVELIDSQDQLGFTQTFDYTVPSGEWKIACRCVSSNPTAGTTNDLDVIVDGQPVGLIETPDSIGWENTTGGSFDLSGGTELNIETQSGSDANAIVDVFAIYDDRETYTFDNTVDEDNGYLDGPELYPNQSQITTSSTDTPRNIDAATVTATINDTSNNQALSLSNDNGNTTNTGFNTSSYTSYFNFGITSSDFAGRQLVTGFVLGRYDNGERNKTPQFGYLGQTISDFETTVDLDDRIVFVDLDVERNHFDNLQKLHRKGDFGWTIEHGSESISNIPVFSYPRGQETRSLSDIDEIESTPEVDSNQYYNTITLQGQKLDDGTRPQVDVQDDTAVSNDGKNISPGVLRDPNVTTDAEATFRARALLRKALKNGELRGQKTIPPTFAIEPGYAYPVSWLDDPTREQTAEEVSIRKSISGSAETTLDFVKRNDLARDIEELRNNTDAVSDEI